MVYIRPRELAPSSFVSAPEGARVFQSKVCTVGIPRVETRAFYPQTFFWPGDTYELFAPRPSETVSKEAVSEEAPPFPLPAPFQRDSAYLLFFFLFLISSHQLSARPSGELG